MPIAPFVRRRRYPVIEDEDEAVVTYAADFEKDTANEYLSIVDNPSLSIEGDMSIVFWVNFESLATEIIVSKMGNAGQYGYDFYIDGVNVLFRVSNDGTALSTTAKAVAGISTGTWYYFSAYHDDGTEIGVGYNNGAFGVVPHVTGIFDSNAPFHLGRGFASLPVDGLLAYVGIWSKKLSAGENTTLVAAGPNLQYSGLSALLKTNLVSWWDLEEASGARVDSHGSNDLTDNNTVGRAEVVYP